MQSLLTARDAVSRLFANVREVDGQVVRGEKRHEGKCYAVAYIDLADDVVGRAAHLEEFQERILGNDFFDSPEQLRWNNYLYIVAGPKSMGQIGFAEAKAAIEADKDYARKRVVLESEFESLLGDSTLVEADGLTSAVDVVGEWVRRLEATGLDELIEKPTPRTDVVERISNGNLRHAKTPANIKVLSSEDARLSHSRLRSLVIEKFRPVHDGKSFAFAAVTLIVGPNGSGKTSLLEAIEFLYCGHNRRSSASAGHRVSAKLFNPLTSETFSLSSTNDAGRIKARCLAWYKRDERVAKSIVDGFTRYNFLDTDAAFRISTDLDPDEISLDLSRLLVGGDAASLWTYLSKITSDLETALAKVGDRLENEHRLALSDGTELKRLQEQPSVAHTLTANYRAALGALDWKGRIEHAPRATTNERQPLESTMRNLDVLVAAGSGAATVRSIRARRVETANAVTIAEEIENRRLQLIAAQEAALIKSNQAGIDAKFVERWIAYCSVGFDAAHADWIRAKSASERTLAALGQFASVDLPEIPPSYLRIPLDAAESAVNESIRTASANASSLVATIKTYGQLIAIRSRAALQLQEAAVTLLEHGHPAGDCPICHTKHDAETLMRMIAELPSGMETPAELQGVNEALERNRTTIAQEQKTLAELSEVRRIALQLRTSTSAPASEVLDKLVHLRNESQALAQTAAVAKRGWDALLTSGLSFSERDEVRAKVLPLLDDTSSIDSVEGVTRLRDNLILSIRQLDARHLEIRQELERASAEIASVAEVLRTPDWPDPHNVPADVKALLALHEAAGHLESQVKQVSDVLRVDEDARFENLRQTVAAVIQGLDAALHATLAEAKASQAIAEATEKVERGGRQIGLLAKRRERLKSAFDVLKTLATECSLETATQESLHAIGEQINDAFRRIHAPREYEYVGKGTRLLQTHSTKEARTLEQVSTGQRAAFALSIFLALTRTAKSAPPLLLIDDPVAHVDDLNVLSFMDYLRDLAVNSRRQIFFATADSRVASLFEKKFSFLGTDAFQTLHLSRLADS